MGKKPLSLGEKIALAASGAQEEEFPEDIEYETSAKVVDLDEDGERELTSKPVRSSLRTKNTPTLDELDERYSGLKVSRKKLAKDNGILGPSKSKVLDPKIRSQSSTEDEGIDDSGSEDEEDDLDNDDLSSGEDLGRDNDNSIASDIEDDQDSNEEESGEDEDDDDAQGGDLSGSDVDDESDEEESEADEAPTVQTLSSRDQQSEIEKGKATLNQIRIWDSLLEVRIRLQKMLLDCNRLPHTGSFDSLLNQIESTDDSKLSEVLQKSQNATKMLMHELLRLQSIMKERNMEVDEAMGENGKVKETSNNPMDEEITSESDEEESDSDKQPIPEPRSQKRKIDPDSLLQSAKKMKPEQFQTSAESFFSKFLPYRNQIIQKWNDKTQFAGGKFNKKASQQVSTLRQIEQILSNKDRLLKRTQVRRSNYQVIGDSSNKSGNELSSAHEEPETNPEIFDDDDFYHQLLRELIERKTSNVNDPIQLSQHWLELQKLRSKLKRKVDTKASKGRKIRYDVHSKLVNFMAPQDSCTMSSAAVKELFASLFGKTNE